MPVCTVLTSSNEVEALAQPWRDLHRRVGLAPFTDYDWAMAWWRTIGKPAGAQMIVVACHEGDRLIGVLPFTVRIKHGVRILRLLGHEVYYYRNFLIEDSACVPMMWQTALAMKVYDFANIKNIHEDSAEQTFMAARALALHKSRVYHCFQDAKSKQELLATRSKAFQRNYRRVGKMVGATDGMSMGLCRDTTYDPAIIDFLVRQKKQWTIDRGKRGVFNEENTMDFYHEITRLGAENGSLVLQWMNDGGRPFGVTLNFIEKNVIYGHTLAINMAYGKYMPGIFMNMELMMWACENGYSETNYMEGEEEYKTRFANHHRIIYEYAITRTLKGQAFLMLYRLLRLIRQVKTNSATKKSEPKG